MNITGTGIWSPELRYGEPDEIAEAAAELEALGYSAIWIPDVGGDLFTALDRLLAATTAITIASGVLNIWQHSAEETATWWTALPEVHRGRVLLGVGISHGPIIGESWRRPVATVRAYLDALDTSGVPVEARCLAALGPKMLGLARDRSAGAHPYLATPEHTALARDILGPGPLLAPEQGIVLEADPERARAIARSALGVYTSLPNFVNNWKRLGLTDDDVATLSDRLVDAIVACGDVDAIAARVAAHRTAGADHVCIQVLKDGRGPMPRQTWRSLASALTGPTFEESLDSTS